jgi:hypothetical protein
MNKKENEVNAPMNVEYKLNGKYHSFKSDILQKLIIVDKNYSDFQSFYKDEKRTVYLGYIDAFEMLINLKCPIIPIKVHYLIEGQEYFTHLKAEKNNSIRLIENILPFFEQLEEYETCSKIIKLHKSINQ